MPSSPRRICSTSIATLLFASLSLTTAQRTEAAPTSWTGGADASWDNVLNWSLGVKPTAADAVTFGLTHPTGTAISLTTGELANTLTFSDEGYSLTGGSLTLTAGAGTITVDPTFTASIGSILAGTTVTKAGTGALVLSGANTFTGLLTISEGTLRATTSATALGAGTATLTLGAGVLELANDTSLSFGRNTTVAASTQITADRRTVGDGTGITHTLGTLSIGAQTLTIATGTNVTSGTVGLTFGAVTLTGAATINTNAGALTTVGTVAGAFGLSIGGAGDTTIAGSTSAAITSLTKSGSGTLRLTADPNQTGAFTVNGGVMEFNHTGATDAPHIVNSGGTMRTLTSAIGTGQTVTLNGTGIWDIRANNTIARLLGDGLVTKGTAGAVTLTLNSASNATFGGVIEDGLGTLALSKTGANTVTLAGLSTFTGAVTVTTGALQFSTVSNNGGAASNLGRGTNGILLGGGTLSFIGGASQSTNRGVTLTASSILDASGTGGTTITYAGPITVGTDFSLSLTGTGGGLITGGITQPAGTAVADLLINSGTWTLSGATSVIADDVIVTGNTAVLNLNTTGVLAGTGGSNGLYGRTDAVINLGANDVNGVANSGGNDFIFLGDTGVGTLNTNGFNITTPRLDIGDDDNLIDAGHITGSGTLTVTTDFNFYRGSISANLVGSAAVQKFGLGDVTLSGDNSGLTTAASPTEINGGNLILDYTTSNATKLSTANSLDMKGGKLTLNGNASASTSQSVLAFTLANGGFNEINVNRGGLQSATLNLGAITRGTGQGTIRFGLPVSGAITTTTGNTGTTGILGGWATATDATGTYFAKNDGANNIVAVATTTRNDVTTWATGEHISDATTGFTGTLSNAVSINSLRFNAAGPSTIIIGDGLTLGVSSGGILQTDMVTGGTSLITGGRLASGAASELIFTTDSASQLLTVASTITGTENITKSGNGILRLSGNNNFTGATRIQAGTLQVSGGNAIGDTSAVPINAAQSTVFELLSNETIGTLSGGQSANLVVSEVRLGGNALTVNQSASGTYAGIMTGNGSSSLIKNGAGNLQFTGASGAGYTGTVTVNSGLFYLTNLGSINSTGVTVNKSGVFMLDKNGTTRTGTAVPDNMTITLNSADGVFGGQTIVRGLSIRTDQAATTNETVGVITLNSGASYADLEATATGAITALIADNIVRSNNATFDVRGTAMTQTANARGQLRIGTAGNQTTFIGTMVGGGTALGTKSISIVPWAIAQETAAGVGITDLVMGNSLAGYVSGQGFRALDLTTEYNTYTASAIATENIRESLAADLTGLSGKTINALVLHDATTAAGTLNVTGTSGTALTITSGAMLFTLNPAATASSAHNIVLGGLDTGIATAGTNPEYVIHVVNPSALAATPTLSATISSPLTSTADITKSGRGTLILTGMNTAGGGAKRTTINEGVLQIANLNNIGGSSGALVFAGGTLKLGAGFVDDISTRAISFLQGGGTLDTSGIDVTFANSLGSGVGGFTKIGAGSLTLNAAATYTGATTLTGGTVVISNNNSLGSTAPINFNGGTLRYATGATNTDISGRSISFTTTPRIDTNGLNVTYANGVGNSGTGGLTKLGAGTLTLAGTNPFTGTTNVSAGTLQISGSIAIGASNLLVANVAGNAVLNIPTGGSVTTNMLQVGSAIGSVGAVNLTGGSITMTQTETAPDAFQSFGAATGSYGAFAMSAGTMTTTRFMFGGTSVAGSSGIGVGLVSGGIVNTNGYLLLARNGTSTGILTITGGTINHTAATQQLYLGLSGSGRAELNVNGGLIDNTGRSVWFSGGGFSWTGTGILNLNAGTLLTDSIVHNSGTSYVSFSGGILKASAASTAFVPATISAAYVNGAFGAFAGGAVVDTNNFDITIAEPLLAPAGSGVSSLAVTTEGAGYIGAPAVLISGGAGTGATAIANMVDDGTGNGTLKVGSLTITNPGVNYTGTPTFTLSGGGATTAATAGLAGTALNTSGGLTKLSSGTLTLSGANTFGGPVIVNGGTLSFSTGANLGDSTKSTNTIGVNGATLSYTGSTALNLGPNRTLTVGSGGATFEVGAATAALTFSGGVTIPGTANLVKNGAGSLILDDTINLHGGTTTVSGGLLRTGFGSAGTSALSVAAGATLQNVDASATTLVLPNTGSLTFNAGATLGTASTLGFGLNASTAAGITLTSGGTLTINGSGTVFVDVLSLGTPLSAITYNLLSVPAGGLLTGSGGAVNYALNDVAGGYTYTLNPSSTLLSVTVALFSGTLAWHGDLTGPAGSWTDFRSGDTNWRNAITGGTDIGVTPGRETSVVFSATEATGPALSTTLDGDVTIKNLQFTSNPAGLTSVSIAQGTGGSLTIAPSLGTDGINVADNAGIITFSAPLVAGSDQTWNVAGTGANGSSLTVSGGTSGLGNVTKTGAGTLTFTAANAAYNANLVWNGGGLTITPTGSSLVVNGAISGSGSGPLLKDGSGTLALNGANTYTGGTTLNGGTTILGHKQAFGTGTVSTLTNAPTLQASVDLSGANKIANAFVLDTNLTVIGTNNLEIGGTTTVSTGNRTLTSNLTGAAALTLTGNVILGETGFARNLTVSGAGATVINGIVRNGGAGGGWLVKGSGTGTLTLGAANTYTGFTIIDQGTLILAPGVNQSMTNTFYFGSSAGVSTAGTFDLGNASATFTATLAFWNQISSPTNTPAIIVGAGQSLNLNGNVLIGSGSAASTTTLMTASGLGTINVTNAASLASFRLGAYTGTTSGQGNRVSVDFSGLAALNITLNTTNGTVAVSNNSTASTGDKHSTMILADTTNITAKTLSVGEGGQYGGVAGQINALKLGSVANNINVDTFNVGSGMRDFGSVTFDTGTGSIVVRNAAGTGRAALNIASAGGATAVVSVTNQNTFDVTGHSADLLLGAVTIGAQARGDALVSTFSFDQGTLDMTSLTLATRGSSTLAGSHSTTSTVNLGGGNVTIGSGVLQMAQSTDDATTAPSTATTATINITGGTVGIGDTAGTSITMASAVANTSATAFLNLTGGTTTLTGNVVKGGGLGTTSATVTLSGTATLDMGAKSIGTAANPITFNAESGTLQNLGQLNGGGALTKTTAGTLTVLGSNGYTGATNVNAGTLVVSGSISGTASVTVSNGGTLLFAGAGNHINDVAPVILGGGPTPGSGGIFNTGGVSEGPDNVTQNAPAAMGALTLSLNSTIDFTTGNGSSLLFSNLTYTPGEAVRILNWTGTAGGDNGVATNDRLLFSGTSAAFTNEQLASIQFFGDNNLMISSGATQISFNGYTELVPVAVPEPSTWLSALTVLGLIGYRERRRLGHAFASRRA